MGLQPKPWGASMSSSSAEPALRLALLHATCPSLRRCGPSTFRVNGLPDENKPQNILEEIVW